MSTATNLAEKVSHPHPPLNLPIENQQNVESDWHRSAISLLIDSVRFHFRSRRDFFAGGNMFIHFSEEQVRNQDFRGPDFFFVWGAEAKPSRDYWAVWEENGKYPDMILELLSPTTEKIDRTVKKDVYAKTFRTPDYFLYDSQNNSIEGFHLKVDNGCDYIPLKPNEDGRLWCGELQLWLGTWSGKYQETEATWPRFFDAEGTLVMTRAEAAETELALLKAQRSHGT